MLELHERRAVLYRVALDSVPTGQQNIRRGLAALERAILDKTTVHRAMHRDGLGWIDFVWGDEGRWPPTSRGRRKGEKGISHALEARQRKDGMSHAQAVQSLRRMIYAISDGAEIRPSVSVANVERVIVGKDGTEVHLIKRQGSNAWTLTVFDEKSDGGAPEAV